MNIFFLAIVMQMLSQKWHERGMNTALSTDNQNIF